MLKCPNISGTKYGTSGLWCKIYWGYFSLVLYCVYLFIIVFGNYCSCYLCFLLSFWKSVPYPCKNTIFLCVQRRRIYNIHTKHQGPVVQSVVSLTSSLRAISLTILADSIYNFLKFFAEKMWVAFALQKLLTFFQQKNSEYLRITRCKF